MQEQKSLSSLPLPPGLKIKPRTSSKEPEFTNFFMNGLEVFNRKVEKEDDLIQSLIVKGALSSLVGSSGIGKSTLARQLAFAIIQKASSVLNFKINTEVHDVIYWSTEDTISQWTKRLQEFNQDGTKAEALKRLHLLFGTRTHIEAALKNKLAKSKIALVVVDVYSDVYVDDPNCLSQVRKFLMRFKNLAHDHSTSFLFIHHNGKRTEKIAPTKNNVIGSQGFEASMRSVFELRGDQYDASLKHLCLLKQNYISESEKRESHILKLNDDLTFTSTGERKDLAFLAMTSQKVCSDPSLIKEIITLSLAGLSSRAIERSLTEQGIEIKKTKIAEIIKQHRDSQSADIEKLD